MAEIDMEVGMGAFLIAPPKDEDDAVGTYTGMVEARSASIQEQQWSELVGKAAAPAPGGAPAPGAPSGAPAPAPVDQGTGDTSIMDKAGSVLKDVGRGLVEAPSQVVGGIADAFGEAGQLLGEITGIGGVQFFDQDGKFNPDYLNFEEFQEAGGDSLINAISTDPADSVTGGFVRSTSQFLTGFIPALKGTKAVGITGAVTGAFTAGAVADMVVFDPHEDRLSTFLNEVPVLEPYVSDYLADNNPENESSWEGRIKNAVEGGALGLTADAAGALFRAFKYYKVQRAQGAAFAPEAPSVQAQAGRDALKEAAREELVNEIPDEALSALGTADGPRLMRFDEMKEGETTIQAYLRGVEATKRAELSVERNNALGRIQAATEAAQSRLATDTPEAAFDAMIDAVRTGARPSEGGKAPEGKIFINHSRINSSDDVKAVLQEMADMDAEAITEKTRGVVSNDQTIRESSQEYRDLDDLIGRPPGPMSAAQAVAARRLLTSSGEQIVELAKKASAAEATPADIYNFRRSMAVHYAIQSEVIAARSETARALQSWAIPVGATPARSQAITDLIMQNGGAGDLQALAKAVGTVGNNPAALNSMARELGKGRFGKALYQVWINGILSGVKTHVVNVTSNAAVAVWAIPERLMAAGISKAFYAGEIDVAEVSSMAYGFTKGARDGIRMIYHGNNAGDVSDLSKQFDALGKPEVHMSAISAEAFGMDNAGPFGVAIDFIGKVIDVPGIALQAEDKFFKSIGYRMQLNALASRMALSEGLDGEDFAKRVADILADPPASLRAEAVDYSAVQTFTNKLGPTGQKGMNFIRSVPGGRLVMPFVQTPTNIIKYSFARTPLAYLSGAIKSEIRAGGARAAQAHARIATGSMLMLAMADMTLEGTIVGGGPTDPEVRRAWMADGNQPYSVKVDGRSYQYSRLDPIGLLMGLAADISEISNQANQEDSEMIVMAGVTALASNLASKTYLRGIFDFIGAIDASNPMKSPTTYTQNFSGSLMPYSSFVRSIAQTSDPIMRDTKDLVMGVDGKVDGVATFLQNTINKMRANIPGLSDDLPPRRDLFGAPIDRSSGLGMAYDFASPVASRQTTDDPVVAAIVDNRIKISNPQRVIGGVELNAEQFSEFSRLAGEPLKEHLDNLVRSSGFQRLSDGPDGMKAEVIRSAVNTFRDQAKAMMMRQYPELQRLSYQRQLDRAQILQGGQN